MAKHKTTAEWQILVNQFLQSNQTRENFCTQHKINPRTFENRYYAFKSTKKVSSPSTAISNKQAFVKLKLPTQEIIKIKLPNGIAVELAYNNLSTIIKELAYVI